MPERWKPTGTAPRGEVAIYKPGEQDAKARVRDRKKRFARLNEFVTMGNGWITSIPGRDEVTVEVLEGSTLPDELREIGYRVEPDGSGERILARSIVEKFARVGDELVPMTAGSTLPLAEVRTHAGIVRTQRYSFSMA
jgi:hypothetical protein